MTGIMIAAAVAARRRGRGEVKRRKVHWSKESDLLMKTWANIECM
jgi:hypothetical protein